MDNYKKQKISLRYWLLGQGYYKAVEAMNFAERYHNGKRKDGQEEFSHQVSQANLIRTLIHHVTYKEEVFIVIFLHDICEDKGISFEEIENRFGKIVADAVRLITKEYRGVKITNEQYYPAMAECEITSVAKGCDRVHNLMTMLNGFKPTKRVSYIKETKDFTIPMLKQAKRNFPHQESVYENIKFIMDNQIQLYNALDEKLNLEVSN
jgi:(p)ppGpp synthase/HD superfamily hydrolase